MAAGRRKVVANIPARTLAAVYPLSGLVRCGHCHGSMAVVGQPGRPGYTYRCCRQRDYKDCPGSRPRRKALEDAVIARLQEWAADVDQHRAVGRARKAARSAALADADKAKRALTAADRALVELVKNRARNPDMPTAVFEQAQAELLEERTEAQARVARAQTEAHQNTAQDHLPIVLGLLHEWKVLPAARRRDMLAQLIRHVKSYKTGNRKPPRIAVTPVWEECNEKCCIQTEELAELTAT